MTPQFSNLGSWLTAKVSVGATATAGGTGDATETDGAAVDRQQNGAAGATVGNSLAMCAKFVLFAQATLTASKTATLTPTIQHSTTTTGGDFVDCAAALQPSALVLSATGAQYGVREFNLDLSSLNRYLRAQVLIDLSASGTDTAFYLAGFDLGGFEIVPVS